MKFKKPLLILLSLIIIAMFTLEMQRQWTRIPSIRTIHIVEGTHQAAVVQQASIGDFLHQWSTFAYFTTWANMLFVILFVLVNIFGVKVNTSIKMMFLSYLGVTSLVFWTSIAPYFPWGQSEYLDSISIYEHTFLFLVSIIWIYSTRSKEKVKGNLLYVSIFPVLYMIFITIFTLWVNSKVSVYPFINFKDWFALGWGTGWSWVLTILSTIIAYAIIIGTYYGCIFLYNWKRIKKITK